MTLELALVLKANAEQAKRTLAEVSASVGETGKAAEAANRKAEEAARKYSLSLEDIRARFNPLFAATRAYEAELKDIAAAESLGAISAREAAAARESAASIIAPTRQLGAATRATAAETVLLANSQGLAAAQTGNLFAQFQDIGVMLAAGQSPLQLALQQGTQISQVIGPLGAGGAVRALGAAFLSLISPVNLIVIGSIAAGAAMYQWLTSAAEDAETLEDRVSALTSATRNYESAVDRALTPLGKLRAEWGGQAKEVRAIYKALADLARLDSLSKMEAAASAVRQQFEGLSVELDLYRTIEKDIAASAASGYIDPLLIQQSRRELDALQAGLQESFGLTIDQATRLDAAIENLGNAAGPAEIADAAAALRAEFVAVAAEAGRLPGPLLEAAQQVITAELEARKLAGPLAESASSAETIARVDMAAGIAGATAEAWNLAAALGVSLEKAMAIAGINGKPPASKVSFGLPGAADPIIGGVSSLTFGDNPGEGTPRDGRVGVNLSRASTRRGGSGARTEADAVQTLIEKLEIEQQLLQETDPLQRALLGYRKELALATGEQRTRIEELVASNLQAQAATESLGNAFQSAGDAIIDALMGGKDAGEQLIKTLIRAGLQAALLGQGPLAGLFGGGGQTTGGVGGLLGGLLGGVLRRAEGGPVYGPGTGTSDDVPALLSNGEYVVNARATARYRAVLDAMNSGGLPGLAVGGPVGGGSGSGPAATGGGIAGRLRIDLGEGLVAQILDQARDTSIEVTQTSLSTYHEKVLPDAVRGISNAPRDRR